jgi:RNA polymerase sigma-70 factor, ECF subfamily
LVGTPSASLQQLATVGLAGDGRAYAAFLEAIAVRLRAYFRRRLFVRADEGEDLVQEVLLAIHEKRATFDARQPVTAWVFGIARYKLADHFRRVRRIGVQIPVNDADELFAEGDVEIHANEADLMRLLEQLPDKQRRVIRMVKIEDRSVREAAQEASLSESDVKVSIHRGLKTLSKLVKRDSL